MELNAQAVEGIHLQGGTLLVGRWTACDMMMQLEFRAHGHIQHS